MAEGFHTRGWSGPSRRRVPRFRVQAPLDVTVLRSGIPDAVPGRSINVCERGIAAVLAGELNPGESVGVEVRLSAVGEPLRTRAIVRYQEKLLYGLEFMTLSEQQRSAIRDWAKQARAVTDPTEAPWLAAKSEVHASERKVPGPSASTTGPGFPGKRRKKRRAKRWMVAVLVLLVAAAIFWWRWNRGWAELESQHSENLSAETTRVQVPAEMMQKLLVHRVEPIYPADARKQHLQGIIAVDVIVGRDGSVESMRALNGPDVLAQAAMDALRWWKFEPYRVNGQAAVAETTLAVEFKN
ncbi:MAG: TonB family protein [Candidatus Sulfotelmatobacter sp.]